MSAAESVKNGSSLWEGMKVELDVAVEAELKFIHIVGSLFCFQVKRCLIRFSINFFFKKNMKIQWLQGKF